jgi:hypothetical protein
MSWSAVASSTRANLATANSTLEAIAALANTFGGVVLVGVDEDKRGLDRLTGVDAGERDRLSRMCWDKLVPPFSPEIIPIKLDADSKYVLAVTVDPDYARRPVMLTQGNKVPVRIEGHNTPADWYRLRDLFAEQPASTPRASLPPETGPYMADLSESTPDFCVRGRLLLAGARGHRYHVSEPGRTKLLADLNSNDSPLTGSGSAVVELMHNWTGSTWDSRRWKLEGRASTQMLNARWHGIAPGGQYLTRARLTMALSPNSAAGDSLMISLETLLTNPIRATLGDQLKEQLSESPDPRYSTEDADAYVPEGPLVPFLDLGDLRKLILGTLSTLWGSLGAQASISILGQPLGPPAEIAMAVSTIRLGPTPVIPLNTYVNFGLAQLIPGNTPGEWYQFPTT